MENARHWEILAINKKDIFSTLLINRRLKTKKEITAFLHPDLKKITTKTVGISKAQLFKAKRRVEQAIKNKEQIVVYGDYDVDGITGTAILWESLQSLGAKVTPYIPKRLDEGYGLSIKGIENILQELANTKLIITVDNGIVAGDPVAFAKKKGIDVLITDHHTFGKTKPQSFATIHTTKLCGAAVAYVFSQKLLKAKKITASFMSDPGYSHLSLVALATVADLVPLTGVNRILLTEGLKMLQQTKRPGLKALFKEAVIDPKTIDVYTIGHVIAPRLNAMGRLESAMDSLRLLCTTNASRAANLAQLLGRTNKSRQQKTLDATAHAITHFKVNAKVKKSLLFIAQKEYEEGIIGLIAGKLVEEFYLPAIVLSKGKKISKASARSINGFNIIEFIRTNEQLLVNAGGHPMAAGFTVETDKIEKLQKALEKLAKETLNEKLLQRTLKIDMQIPLEQVNQELYEKIQQLAPFGIGNPEPLFASAVVVKGLKTVGAEEKHLKLSVAPLKIPFAFSAIGFGLGGLAKKLQLGQTVDITYTIDENIWNGRKEIQLKVRDIKI